VRAICWPIAKIYGTEFLLEKLLLTHLVKKFTAYLKLKVHFHAHKDQHLDLILHQTNSVHTILLISLTSTFILSLYLQCLSLSSNLFSSDFPTKILEVFFIFPILVTSFYHLILLDFISIQIYGKQDKFRRFSLCNFSNLPITSSLLLLLLLALQSLKNLFQNCPPLFLGLRLTFSVSCTNIC